MPLIIATLVIAAIAGTFASRLIALAVTGVAATLTMLAFIWAVADGQGDDPVWVIAVAVVGCAIAMALADALSRRRLQHRSGA